MNDDIPANTSKLEESFHQLPQLTDDDRAALESMPDDAVSHWAQGEKWDFKKRVWVRFQCET